MYTIKATVIKTFENDINKDIAINDFRDLSIGSCLYDIKVIDNDATDSIIHVDGGGYNGTKSQMCVFLVEKHIPFYFSTTENLSNNVAEYKSMIIALENHILPDGVIYTDSLLMAHQLNGIYQVRSLNLIKYYKIALELKKQKNITIKWLRRNKNLAGLYLDNLK